GTDAEAVGTVEHRGLAPAHRVTLQVGARNGLGTKLLAGATKSTSAQQLVETGRPARDVEITLVEGDAAVEASIRVHSDAKDQAASRLFLDCHQDVLEFLVAIRVEYGHGRLDALGRVDLEDVEARQVLLGDLQIRVRQGLARIEADLPANDVVARH